MQVRRAARQWKEMWDNESGCTYYQHSESGETVWEKPEGFDQAWLEEEDPKALAERSRNRRQVRCWQELLDEDSGTIYYYNSATGQKQWEKPDDFDEHWLEVTPAPIPMIP